MDSDDAGDVRRDRHGDARMRAAVLDTTVAVLAEVGYQRLRAETVAARAGVPRGLLRRWWATRPLLVAEALQRSAEPGEVLPSGDVRADVRALVLRTASFLDDPLVVDAVIGLTADATRDPIAAERLGALLAPRRAADTAVLLSAVARGDLPAGTDVSLLLDVVFGTLLFRRVRSPGPGAAVIDAMVEQIVGADPVPDPPTRHASDGHGTNGHALNGHALNGHATDGQATEAASLPFRPLPGA